MLGRGVAGGLNRMVKEYTYSPHVDFYIDMIDREHSYDMGSFHTHHKYELYYEVEGARRYFIEDSAYIVNAGNVILIGENQIHKTGSVGDGPTSRIVCNFSREYLQEISGAFPEIDLFSFMSEENNHLLSNITVKQQNYIYSILQQLIQMQDENNPESAVTRKMLLATLLLQLKKMCENQHELGGDSGRVTNRIVSQIQGYIAEHYAEKLTLTSIANQFYISPYYLSRLFKKTINLSLIEYINGVRIKAAQNMIEKTNESISSVAEKTGFMTSAHFRRVFKDATGLSPQQYRQYFKRVNKPEKIRPKMLQHKTTTPGGCQQAAAFVLPLTDKQGRGERCKGISRKGTIMCRNTAESRKPFYSGCILNIRNGQKREKPVAGVFKIKAARYPFCSGTGQPVWWFGRKKIKSFGENLKLSPLHCQRQCRQ